MRLENGALENGTKASDRMKSSASSILKLGSAMVAELARVRFFVEALKSGDSSYPKIKPEQTTSRLLSSSFRAIADGAAHRV
jgi:hypothetical protein